MASFVIRRMSSEDTTLIVPLSDTEDKNNLMQQIIDNATSNGHLSNVKRSRAGFVFQSRDNGVNNLRFMMSVLKKFDSFMNRNNSKIPSKSKPSPSPPPPSRSRSRPVTNARSRVEATPPPTPNRRSATRYNMSDVNRKPVNTKDRVIEDKERRHTRTNTPQYRERRKEKKKEVYRSRDDRERFDVESTGDSYSEKYLDDIAEDVFEDVFDNEEEESEEESEEEEEEVYSDVSHVSRGRKTSKPVGDRSRKKSRKTPKGKRYTSNSSGRSEIDIRACVGDECETPRSKKSGKSYLNKTERRYRGNRGSSKHSRDNNRNVKERRESSKKTIPSLRDYDEYNEDNEYSEKYNTGSPEQYRNTKKRTERRDRRESRTEQNSRKKKSTKHSKGKRHNNTRHREYDY